MEKNFSPPANHNAVVAQQNVMHYNLLWAT